MLIDMEYFMSRIGTKQEQKRDRKFVFALYMWSWKTLWRKAEEKGDYTRMASLRREYESMQAL